MDASRLITSWLNGERNFVRNELKKCNKTQKKLIVNYAREKMSVDDFVDFNENANLD